MAISSLGVGSNLDLNSIITQLMAIESQPLKSLAVKEASYQAKLSAYGGLSGALSSFQGALAGLSDLSKFQQLTASSSEATVATAAATSKAVAGSYNINLTQLAQAQSLASAGVASASAPIGDGAPVTLTFRFGTISGGTLGSDGRYAGAAFTENPDVTAASITIDSSNNSLQGIRDAINKANLGVTATIVADGSAEPNRLVLTSNKTGVASSMKISVDSVPVDGETSSDTALKDLLAYDPAGSGTQKLTQTSAAQNTLLTLNGIAVTSATNTITGAIDGVTLTASKVGTTTISIARDTSSTQKNVSAFVKSYNELTATLKSLTAYNADTKIGGPLLGDSTVRAIQNELSKMITSPATGLSGSLTNLPQIGVSLQKDGTLALDSAKLQKAMDNNFNDIGKLFAVTGTASDSLISYAGSTLATKAGSNAINISVLATKGQLVGSTAANTAITAGVNDELTLIIDGITSTIKLSTGNYTPAKLAAHLQATINGDTAFSKESVAVEVSADSNGVLTLTSNRYGTASKVAVSGNGAESLLGVEPMATTGVDVAGTINGVAAAGAGQFLTAGAGSNAAGLKIQITGGSPGDRGTLDFSQGYASQLSKLIDGFLGSDGLISSRTDGLNRGIKDVGKSRDAVNLRLTNIEAQYRKQFTALDVMISNMTSTSNYLTQQLAALANLNKQ
ncbi:MAG TPA: flagellar filament capping protein FliD [Burkholderiaceae bacterium]|nr:flagellar filament capping protein FliD [Burkholderiaceae bacterium]